MDVLKDFIIDMVTTGKVHSFSFLIAIIVVLNIEKIKEHKEKEMKSEFNKWK